MKKITLALALFSIGETAFCQPSAPPPPPTVNICPTSLKRSNGSSNCPNGQVQLTLNYATCPPAGQIIDSVYISGVKINVTFSSPSTCSGPQNSVKYCVTSGSLPPTGSWRIFFRDVIVNSKYDCSIPEGGPLPISLTGFFAKRNGSKIALSWTTGFEQNAKSFEIERSEIGKDFIGIATVNASNKANGSAYSYTDVNAGNATYQYRLKMVDLDGTFKYSDVRVVKGTGIASNFTVFPNPSSGDAKITVTDISEGTDIQVLDNAGRVIRTINMRNNNNVIINGLQKGMYMIRMVNNQTGETVTKKLTVIN